MTDVTEDTAGQEKMGGFDALKGLATSDNGYDNSAETTAGLVSRDRIRALRLGFTGKTRTRSAAPRKRVR